jgi:uncharacterized protein YndB with AHSA1/START domain
MTTKTAETNAKQATDTNTIRLHRVLKAPPERVSKASLDPAANSKWLPPHGFTCTVHHLDAQVGGAFKMKKKVKAYVRMAQLARKRG